MKQFRSWNTWEVLNFMLTTFCASLDAATLTFPMVYVCRYPDESRSIAETKFSSTVFNSLN